MTPKRAKSPRQRNQSGNSVCSSSLSSETPSKTAATDALFSQGLGIGRFRLTRHPNIFKMIESEDWSQVRHYIQTDQGSKTCTKLDTSGLSVLGMALGFHAPIDIVIKMLEIDPNSSLKYDMFHAVPLHVACLNGANLDVVNYLLDHDDNTSAHCADSDKRVALHHAVEYACKAATEDERENDGIDVIKSLTSAAPTMLKRSDIQGDTPIDLCQMVKYEIEDENHPNNKNAEKVYKILREANIRLYRKEKKQSERKEDPRATKSHNSNETGSTGESTGPSLKLMENLSLPEIVDTSSPARSNKKKRKKKTFLVECLLENLAVKTRH
mmetsp:Transcript_19798/g.23645  ORF Transcript_19798/g.23645 Transcript_19798/m.23645 type:complete len:326 (-) Transcript_19798:148-1125(-)